MLLNWNLQTLTEKKKNLPRACEERKPQACSSDTREDPVKDRAGHWLQVGWRLWRDSWGFDGRRAAAGLLLFWLPLCLSQWFPHLSCWLAGRRGEGHSGCNYIIAADYPSALCVLCTHPHRKVFMLLKCFQFKCHLFLPGHWKTWNWYSGNGPQRFTSLIGLGCSHVWVHSRYAHSCGICQHCDDLNKLQEDHKVLGFNQPSTGCWWTPATASSSSLTLFPLPTEHRKEAPLISQPHWSLMTSLEYIHMRGQKPMKFRGRVWSSVRITVYRLVYLNTWSPRHCLEMLGKC